ncbi:MAG: ABC transporter ATP-binding protein [Anaerolineae bacterium]|nr:ABC transporter ATP-binding protein [Anaerolineae bacterium]
MAWQAKPRLSFVSILLSLLQALLPVASAWLLKLLLDAVVVYFEVPADHLFRPVSLFAAGYVVIFSLQKLMIPLEQYITGELQRAIGLLVRGNVYRQTLSYEGIAYLEDPKYHDLQTISSQSVQGAPFIIVDALTALIRAISLLASFLGLLLWLSPLLTLLVLLSAIPHLLIHLKFGQDRFKLSFDLSPLQRESFYLTFLLTGLAAAKELRLFGLQSYLFDKWRHVVAQNNEAERQLQYKEMRWQFLLELLSFLAMALAFFFILRGIFNQQMSVGDIALYSSALAGVQSGIVILVRAIGQTAEVHHFFAQYEALQTMPQPIAISPRPQPVRPLRRGIEFRDVWFRYTADSPWVLKGVSFLAPVNQCVALVGANGAGKSTLIKLITRLYDPTQGQIVWDGVDIREFAVADYRRCLSTVFQDFVQYQLPVWENIGLGDVAHIDRRPQIIAAAQQADIADRIAMLPGGYETQLSRWLVHGETGADLSGGEWQKIAIARAFMREAQFILLDEPTAALDAETESRLIQLLTHLKTGGTSLLISHRFSTVKLADQIVVMEDGQICEQGTHAQLMTGNGLYARMYTTQAGLYQHDSIAQAFV